MFDQLILHDPVTIALKALVNEPPQGILFVGPEGVGKRTLADKFAAQLVDHPTHIRLISPDEKGTIPIEVIRDLYRVTRNKQNGHQVVIIECADKMSMEAENAFLKLLEEPRAGLTFIMTALQLESLLPTILSRIQHIMLQPLPDETIRRFVVSKKPGIAQNDLSQLVFLAQGRPGTAINLMANNALDSQRERMQVVKQLIAAKPHERFMLVSKMASNREGCLETLGAMSHVVEVQLSAATNPTQGEHWSNIAEVLEDTQQTISRNGNIRAQLLYLFSRY